MLYSEFIEGTGCKQSEYNYQVYKELEIIYMNSDCTKEHIYEMGKKLVDNSKTEEEIRFENEIKQEMAELKGQLKEYKELSKQYMSYHNEDKTDTYWKSQSKWYRELATQTQYRINALKWVLTA